MYKLSRFVHLQFGRNGDKFLATLRNNSLEFPICLNRVWFVLIGQLTDPGTQRADNGAF
jgi:hypothetical protein